MRCLFYYFSGSGNTRLACDYIADKIKDIEFDFHSILDNKAVDFGAYDVVGFAAFADYWGPSPRFKEFIRSLPKCSGKPAFVFNTFGMISGGTKSIMCKLVAKRGFRVIAGHSLHMPENIGAMILAGMANEQAPNVKEMAIFNDFINVLSDILSSPEALARAKSFHPPLRDRLIPAMPRFIGKLAMGPKFVDNALCTKCRKCVKVCPYGAITITDFPKFEEKKCMTCVSAQRRGK